MVIVSLSRYLLDSGTWFHTFHLRAMAVENKQRSYPAVRTRKLRVGLFSTVARQHTVNVCNALCLARPKALWRRRRK